MTESTSLSGSSLFKKTTLEGWTNLIQDYQKNTQMKRDDARGQIKLQCVRPDHSDSDPSAILSVRYGNYFCWSCKSKDPKREFDPIALTATIAGVAYEDATELFEAYFGLKVDSGISDRQTRQKRANEEILRSFVEFPHFILSSAWLKYNRGERGTPYDLAIEWLHARGLKLRHVKNHFQIGVLPSISDIGAEFPKFLHTKTSEFWEDTDNQNNAHDWFMEYYGGELTSGRTGALLFPFWINPTDVGRVQIRTDFLSKKKNNKYRFHFVSVDQSSDGICEEVKKFAKRPIGFFGLPEAIKLLRGGHRAYLTEGVTDCLAMHVSQIEGGPGVVDIPAIAAAGSGLTEEVFNGLSSAGIYEILSCQDHPDHSGDDVLRTYIGMARDIDLLKLDWPEGVQHKDLCKIMLDDSPEACYAMFSNPDNFITTVDFLVRRAQAEVLKEQAGPEYQQKIVESIMEGVASNANKRAFLERVSAIFEGLSTKELEKALDSVLDKDTIEGFLARIEQAVFEAYDFLYRRFDPYNQKTYIAYRSRKKARVIVEEEVSSGWANSAAGRMINNDFGNPTKWAAVLKAPKSITHTQAAKKQAKRTPRGVATEVKACLESVLSGICTEVEMHYDPWEKLGNGVHRIMQEEEEKILVVNGPLRFLGTFEGSPLNPQVSWQEYMADLSYVQTRSAWCSTIEDVESLEKGNSVNLAEVWDDLYKVISTGWAFVDQEADENWLTALAIYSAVYDFMPNTLLTSISAPAQSGKSKLAKHMFGGKQDPQESVMPSIPFFAYKDFPNTSEPGIRQSFSGAEGVVRRGLVLDEFEWNPNSPKSQQTMSSILDTCRSMLDGSAEISKGTRTGRQREYDLRFPLITAGISEFQDPNGATESRIYRIEMRREAGRLSPKHMVTEKYPQFDGKQLTRNMTVGIYRWAIQIREEAEKLYHRFEREQFIKRRMKFPERANDRSASLLCIAGGVMVCAGLSIDEVERRLTLMFDKVGHTLHERTETVGDQIWGRLMAETAVVPGELNGFEMGFSNDKEYISLFDALTGEDTRDFVGSKKLFPGIRVLQEQEKYYILLNAHYLKRFLDSESLNWVQFKTHVERNFGGYPEKEMRKLVHKITGNTSIYRRKHACLINAPEDLVEIWRDYEELPAAEEEES